MAGLSLALWLSGCSSQSTGNDDTGTNQKDGEENGAGETITPKTLVWADRQEVDLDDAGAQLALKATPDNQFAIAYFKRLEGLAGECSNPILGGPPIQYPQDEVRYAWQDGASWSHETVDTITTSLLAGISLIFQGATPLVSYLGGTPLGGRQVCGGTDAVVARKSGGGWTQPAAVVLSNEATAGGDCPKMQAICDFGDVVGLWSYMAKAPDGTIGLAYRDIHNGYEKESTFSSDLELALTSGGGWSHEWVDLARGAGDINRIAFDASNEPIVVTYNGTQGAITFAKRPFKDWTNNTTCTDSGDCSLGQSCGENRCLCMTDSNCEAPRRCVASRCTAVVDKFTKQMPGESLSFAIGPDGTYLVAYFDPDDKNLALATSADGLTWTRSLIDSDGATGQYPTLMIDPVSQKPVVAYYRCSDYNPNELSCDMAEDRLIFAYFTGAYPGELSTQAKWKKSVASDDRNAFDGMHASMDILPDGTIGIGFYYTWIDGTGQGLRHLMFVKGTWQ